METKMSKKVREQLSWFEVILDNDEREMLMASSMMVAIEFADDLFGNDWKYVATV